MTSNDYHPIEAFPNLLSDPDSIRALALTKSFSPLSVQGVEFYSFAEVEDHFLSKIQLAGLNELKHIGSAFRLTLPTDPPNPTYIHSDFRIGKKTVITYLNPDPPSHSGTSFWFHNESKLYGVNNNTDPLLLQQLDAETFDVSKWTCYYTAYGHYNTTLVFDSELFHSVEPGLGFGDSVENGRLILVSFFG